MRRLALWTGVLACLAACRGACPELVAEGEPSGDPFPLHPGVEEHHDAQLARHGEEFGPGSIELRCGDSGPRSIRLEPGDVSLRAVVGEHCTKEVRERIVLVRRGGERTSIDGPGLEAATLTVKAKRGVYLSTDEIRTKGDKGSGKRQRAYRHALRDMQIVRIEADAQ